jgi:ferredoxin
MAKSFEVDFPDTEFAPLRLERGVPLAAGLTALNCPILFGCRSGICGTCLVELQSERSVVAPPSEEEREVLAIYAPDNPHARLACQLRPNGDLSLRAIESC